MNGLVRVGTLGWQVGITSPVAHLVGEMREVYAGTDWVRMDDPIGEPRSIGKDCRLS